MSWFKRNNSIVLTQSSEIPYVILEDGVFLCFDNLYSTEHYDAEHSIQFIVYPNDISRQSTNYFRLKKFPKVIPFHEIIKLDDAIINGKIIKVSHDYQEDTKSILLAKSSYAKKLNNNRLQSFIESLDEYDKSFLLVGENFDDRLRMLEDSMQIIYHRGWYPTSVSIANQVCELSNRKYCWTKYLPELDIETFGLKDPKEMRRVNECLDNIGVTNKEIVWRG